MARISGIDLPRDKRIEVALTYIYGIDERLRADLRIDVADFLLVDAHAVSLDHLAALSL